MAAGSLTGGVIANVRPLVVRSFACCVVGGRAVGLAGGGAGRAVGLGGGRQKLHPCGPRFAPSLALNAPAQPHRPARTVRVRSTVKEMKSRAGRCPAPGPVGVMVVANG